MYINPHKIHETLWRCDCGKEFSKSSSLKSHARFCKQYIPVDKTSSYKENDNYICECGYITQNFQSFNAHLSHCNIHHQHKGTKRKLRPSELNHSMNWENKTEEEIQEIKKKSGRTFSFKQKTGELINYWKGKHLSETHKLHQRESYLKYLSQLFPGCTACYNKNSIQFIDKLNKKMNWNLQHAENGGEVKMFGYFFDGYDKERNIVFEYDEPRHYIDVENNLLKEKDLKRQNYIIEKLGCKFWRYNEKTEQLYRVN